MRTISDRKRTMQNAAETTYPLLEALVIRACQRAGSRMNAYADVARGIGTTGSWVRKFLGRQPVRLDADTYLNIKAEYERECARWEAEAEMQKARFFALGRADHAMAQAATGASQASQADDDGKTASQGVAEGSGASQPRVSRPEVAGVVGAGLK